MTDLHNAPLGKHSAYIDTYDANLLFAIPRQTARNELGITKPLAFHGVDIWNAYEISWLTIKGKPMIASAVITVPCDSPALFESKSLKLYFNSFNQTTFDSAENVQTTIKKDLDNITQSNVIVKLILPEQFSQQALHELPGISIDNIDIMVDSYTIQPHFLTTSTNNVSEMLKSHLLKSNCLITHQPDWGSVLINYQGKQIDRAGLLQYIISFRQHNEFHEQCVERIFTDIMHHCQPQKLTVYARYTRRGGIDINPFLSNFKNDVINYRNYVL